MLMLSALAGAADLSQPIAPAQLLLIVNVASQCGFMPQYAGLEALHRRFRALGFPCDQFGHQEPGDAAQIRANRAKPPRRVDDYNLFYRTGVLSA